MIDTDKYEGHLSDLKEVAETIEQHRATYALLRDAPLLLAEVKRLREQNKLMVDYFRYMRDGGFTDADWRTVNEWIGDEKND
jgi:hypothetical protein